MNLQFILQENKPKKSKSKTKTKTNSKQVGGNLFNNFSILKKKLNKNLINKSKNYSNANNKLIPASKS